MLLLCALSMAGMSVLSADNLASFASVLDSGSDVNNSTNGSTRNDTTLLFNASGGVANQSNTGVRIPFKITLKPAEILAQILSFLPLVLAGFILGSSNSGSGLQNRCSFPASQNSMS